MKTVSITLTQYEAQLLIQAANVFVKSADNSLQAAADILPAVMKLTEALKAESEVASVEASDPEKT